MYSLIANLVTNVEHRKVFMDFLKEDNKFE